MSPLVDQQSQAAKILAHHFGVGRGEAAAVVVQLNEPELSAVCRATGPADDVVATRLRQIVEISESRREALAADMKVARVELNKASAEMLADLAAAQPTPVDLSDLSLDEQRNALYLAIYRDRSNADAAESAKALSADSPPPSAPPNTTEGGEGSDGGTDGFEEAVDVGKLTKPELIEFAAAADPPIEIDETANKPIILADVESELTRRAAPDS